MTFKFNYREFAYQMELVENTFIMFRYGLVYIDLSDVISCTDLHNADIRPNNGIMSIDEIRRNWEEHREVLTIPTDSFDIK